MKKLIIFNIFLIVFLLIFNFESYAKSEINLNANSENIINGDEFKITVEANNIKMAAYTIWIYFDNDLVECKSNKDNINLIENRVICTWYSQSGKNDVVNNLLELEFKAISEGTATFTMIGEFYDENGNKLDIDYSQIDVIINNKEIKNVNNNISESDATLEIMRLNQEGINPDFDKNIKEYYLIIGEEVSDLEVTAMPTNKEADIKISGNNNLKDGLNEIKILVTSKDRKVKEEYIIYVTKTNNPDKANANLENLAIEYYNLIPEYQDNITNYSVELSNTTEKLNILAVPSNMNAKVEIEGNNNLKVGQNKIVISVTAENGITKKKFYINAYRRNNEEEIIEKEEQQNKIEEANLIFEQMNNNKTINQEKDIFNENDEETIENNLLLIGGIIISIITIIIVIIRIKKKK